MPVGHLNVFFRETVFILNFIYFERDREHTHELGRGRERRRHRIQSRLQDPSCHTEPNTELKPMNCEIMT